jgi:hypothetical protein
MKEGKLNHMEPEAAEAKRIGEMKALSYLERLERLMALQELSYKLRMAKKETSTDEPTDH